MKKSVVIIGKGPSILKSNKKIIDSFDEVAICNFPPIEGYEKHIGTRAHYHFLNANDPNPYKKQILNSLGLKSMFNTHPDPKGNIPSMFPDHDVKYVSDYGHNRIPKFKAENGFDPSTGILAFDFFVHNDDFDTIGLAGFDFFKVSEKGYYFPVAEVQSSHKYLYNNNGQRPFKADGIRVLDSPHDSEKSKEFIYSMVKINRKKLDIIK
jgi:hypothetical protein